MNKIFLYMSIMSANVYGMEHKDQKYTLLTQFGEKKVSKKEISRWWIQGNKKDEFCARCPVLLCTFCMSGSSTFVKDELIKHISDKHTHCPMNLCKITSQDEEFERHVLRHTCIAEFLGSFD